MYENIWTLQVISEKVFIILKFKLTLKLIVKIQDWSLQQIAIRLLHYICNSGKGQEDPGLKDQTQKDPDPKDHGPKDP